MAKNKLFEIWTL